MPGIYKSPAGKLAVLRWYDKQLAALPFEVDSVDVDTPVGRTHVVAAGPPTGSPVVVLHGMNMNAAAMAEALRALAGHCRVYGVDIIGMPGRSAGTRLPRRGEGYPRWLEAVMDGLDLSSASFVGLSFGGWLVLKLAAVAPQRIRAAALLDTGGLVPFTVRGQVLAGLAALRYMWRPTPENGIHAARPFFGQKVVPDPRFVEVLALGYRHTRLDVDLKGLPVLSNSELASLDAPTFVSYGEQDIFFNVESALARARAILPRLAVSETVSGEGHVKSHEAEQRLYERVSTFLRDHVA